MIERAPLRGSRILVTGGAGFIGSHMVDRLLREGVEEVVVVDSLFLGCETNLDEAMKSGQVTFYRDDVEIATSLDYIFAKHDIDIVFHMAAKPINYSFLNPSNGFLSGVTMVLNLLELQRRGAFKTLCSFSTSEVYGTAVYEPMDEKHPRNPTTPYAGGKAAADHAVENYVSMFDLDAYIVRPFNNYGPRQNCRPPLAAIIPVTAWRILNGISPEIQGDGLQSRDFIYVQDTVDAAVKLYDVMKPADSVNISTDGQITMRDLVERICREMNYGGEILQKPARKSDVFCHNASNQKIRGLIDYSLTPFDRGLSETLDWYRNRHNQIVGCA